MGSTFPRLQFLMMCSGLCFVGLLTIGCNSGEVKTVPVAGTVSLGKEPLKSGSIAFHPDSSKGNTGTVVPTGEIESGRYKLSAAGKDGAPVGWYVVTVTSSAPINPKDEYSETKSLIDKKYSSPKDSPLSIEVKDGGGPYDFTVSK